MENLIEMLVQAGWPEPPTEPKQWPFREIERVLSLPLPSGVVQDKPKRNKKTGETAYLDFITWHTAVRILSAYAPGWESEITSRLVAGEQMICVVRLTIHGSDISVSRESSGSEMINHAVYGDTATNAEGQALRRAASKFGLALYLYYAPKDAPKSAPPNRPPASNASKPRSKSSATKPRSKAAKPSKPGRPAASPTARPASDGVPLINSSQVDILNNLAKARGWTREPYISLMKEVAGVPSPSKIPSTKYTAVAQALKERAPQKEPTPA